ncbi:molybdopterin biosynthesis protein [Azotobacter vinelandii CA]|uniref:Molybdopterin biosynthesis protein n=2 Tax=Azotobacter vinelandii TaxID=354 RepID=C1DI35_AZOVD|nr:molybdopterin biosynthesis protein [Azotobacter vinelandii DJ]AGK15651.1 molybdopterin biosynthesis protein [Azotobacter vinelandii CA]AGK19193.1 molybdopterin biosynthesis protein [Azotobacter vinelandii CA6]
MRIEGFGEEGQLRLKGATVLVSRVGGVGGTAAMNLVRAGVGRLILAHGGKVVPEYLNRWQLITPDDLGRPCAQVWAEKLGQIDADVEIVTVDEYINGENVADLVSRADLVVDGAPLFEERYLMNDEAMRQGKPLCMGAMFGMEGYASTFIPGESACLRCVFPEKPEYWTDMKVFPAIGPGPAIVGTTIAMEAIKVLTGFGQPLKNILWFFDLESNTTRYLEIERVKDCPACGASRSH